MKNTYKINSFPYLSTEANVKEKLYLSFRTCVTAKINHSTQALNALGFRYLSIYTSTAQWEICTYLSKVHYKQFLSFEFCIILMFFFLKLHGCLHLKWLTSHNLFFSQVTNICAGWEGILTCNLILAGAPTACVVFAGEISSHPVSVRPALKVASTIKQQRVGRG